MAVLGLVVAVACKRGGSEESQEGSQAGSQASPVATETAAPSPSAPTEEPAPANPVDDMEQQGLKLCEGLIPENLRSGAKLTGQHVGRLLTCNLERDGKQEQMIMIDCSGKTDADDMARMGGGSEKVAIGRAAYRNPFGGVSLLASKNKCRVEVGLKPRAEELAKAIDAALGPDHALVASGTLDCERLIPEALRREVGATAKLEQESVMEGMVSCSLERAARGQLETTVGPTRTALRVGYMCKPDYDWVQHIKDLRRDKDVDVAIGRGGLQVDERELVFADGQAPCMVEVKVRQVTVEVDIKRVATQLEAALTPELVGK
jgi:hypothetical protein